MTSFLRFLRTVGFVSVMGTALFAHVTASSAAARCPVELDAARTPRLEWTGYKTSQKTAVSGTFKRFSVVSALKRPAPGLEALARSLRATLDLTSVSSANDARDTNLVQGFFSHIPGASKVEARVTKLKAERGEIKLALNGLVKTLPFEIKTRPSPSGLDIEAGTVLDLSVFNLTSALGSLNAVCGELHKGADGVSKTWQTVDLKITIPVLSSCPTPSP